MKKNVFVLVALCCSLFVNGQVILDENFDYPIGNLVGNGTWGAYASEATSPVQIVSGGLTFNGYNYSDTDGKAIQLLPVGSSQDVAVKLDQVVSDGSVYLSFLVKIDDTNKEGVAGSHFPFVFFAVNETSSGAGRGRLSAIETSPDTYRFRLLWSHVPATDGIWVDYEQNFNYGETYLVVLKYEIGLDTSSDRVSLYVFDDVPPIEEPAPNIVLNQPSGRGRAYPVGAIKLEQTGGSSTPQNITIDGMVAALSWRDIFKEGQPVENFNNITVEVGADPITLGAYVESGNPVIYSIEEGKESVALLNGNVLTIVGIGEVRITAMADGTDDYSFARKTITLTVVPSLDWLQAPAIAVEGDNVRVAGPGADRFTKIYINDNEGASLTGINGEIRLRATTEDGAEIIRLVISR